MNKKISLINDLKAYNRMAYLNSVSIISAFGDRSYIGIDKEERYDAFISGYISDSGKILEYRELIADAKLDNERALFLCDPVLGDKGKMYSSISDSHVDNYRKLMEISDIITPNFTEASILTGMSYTEEAAKYKVLKYENDTREKVDAISKELIEKLFPMLDKIRFKKNQITIITGIELSNVILTILDIYDGDHSRRQTTCNYSEIIEERGGIGEVFNAMFFEASTNGFNLADSLSAATSFINNSLRYSRDRQIPKELGIFYEPILCDNIEAMKRRLAESHAKNSKNIKEMNENKGE